MASQGDFDLAFLDALEGYAVAFCPGDFHGDARKLNLLALGGVRNRDVIAWLDDFEMVDDGFF
jgi:hypothetical protein